jgi:hypothetical protein
LFVVAQLIDDHPGDRRPGAGEHHTGIPASRLDQAGNEFGVPGRRPPDDAHAHPVNRANGRRGKVFGHVIRRAVDVERAVAQITCVETDFLLQQAQSVVDVDQHGGSP